MSLTKEKREEIKKYILRHIEVNDPLTVAKTMEAYEISRTTVSNYLKQLLRDNVIVRAEKPRLHYNLTESHQFFHYDTSAALEEDQIFKADIAPLLTNVTNNAFEIWRYSFTEMLNNAIEHAEAKNIDVLVSQNVLSTAILIADNGVGIFQKIREYISQTEHIDITMDEAVTLLFSGKFTTDRDNHTGEGIFFSSRVTEGFTIYSGGKIFRHDSFDDAIFDAAPPVEDYSTAVLMRLENQTTRDLSKVMNMFSDVERGFFRTQLPLAHIFQNSGPVSRSEARRLGAMVARFEDVTLDFSGIQSIGQGFTHELFVVFRRNHPDIHFNCINMSPGVEGMIKRVENTK